MVVVPILSVARVIVARVVPKILGAREGTHQGLARLRNHFAVIALHAKAAVEG
jgi:hypothetical protein